MVTVNLLKVFFCVIWIYITCAYISLARDNYKDYIDERIQLILLCVYIFAVGILLLIYGGIYWW